MWRAARPPPTWPGATTTAPPGCACPPAHPWLGTITGALGIDGFALQPLLEVCARDLVGELVLGVPFGFGSLSACTRVAGADANPYLAIAATLAAGLAGIRAQLLASDPLASNGYDEAHGLPRSMDVALEKMQHSVLARQAFGDDFVTGYCAVKALEYDHYLHEISAWERRYLLPQV